MHKCCVIHQSPRPQRRTSGFQLPLNCQQIIGWIILIATALLIFVIVIQIQFDELKMISLIIYSVLYVCHISSHITASIIDPSEQELRKMKTNNVPEFDRAIHAHVIENGRCHLCNIHTSSKHTKHCSLCNKCVDNFDHHCKWLNNCIGQRNYTAFMACVITALMIAILTAVLCITDIVLFITDPHCLSLAAQNFINCTSTVDSSSKLCIKSLSFLAFLIIFCLIAVIIGCALLHLCCFHVYIAALGLSTYEYVVQNDISDVSTTVNDNCSKCSNVNISKKLYVIGKHEKSNTFQADNSEISKLDNKLHVTENTIDTNVSSMISNLIRNELRRAKRMFLYDKNKIHPRVEAQT